MQTQNIKFPFPRITSLPIFTLTVLLLLSACSGGGGGGPAGGGFASGSGENNDEGTTGGGANVIVEGVVGLSQHNSANSHSDERRGTDCMDCHTNGTGTGVFITSGTDIDGIGGYVEYYADSARTDLRARLEIDVYGNYYTVTPIDILTPDVNDFSPGAYVTIVMPNGAQRFMPEVVTHLTASCNECHTLAGLQLPL